MRSGADLRAAVLKAGLWLALAVALVPPVAEPLGAGLDAAYAWGISALPETGSRHGGDVVFPYGPLGWLLLPVAGEGAEGGIGTAAVARLGLHLLFVLLVAFHLRRAKLGQAVAAVVLLLLAELLGLYFDSRLLLLLALLLGPALVGGRAESLPAECLGKEEGQGGGGLERVLSGSFGLSALAAGFAGVLAAVFVLVKVNLGIAAVALLAAALVLAAVGARRARRDASAGRGPGGGILTAWLAAAAGFLGVFLLALPFLGGPGGAMRWVIGQLDLAGGFGGAMSAPGLPGELRSGLLCLGLFAALALHAAVRRSPLAGFWAAHLVPVWLAFKYGFVRQDGHVVLFFTYLIGLCAVAILLDRRADRPGLVPLIGALGILLVGVPAVLERRGLTWPEALRLASGAAGAARIGQALDLGETRAELARRGARQLAPLRLPADFAAPLRGSGVAVDVLPWELSVLPANGLRWRPNPVLQLYNAYTRRLDLWTAAHFAGERAPGFLLAEMAGVDARQMVWDTPETWRAVAQAYEPVWELPAGTFRNGLLGLRRRAVVPEWDFQEVGVQEARVGEWISVPAVGGWIFAHLELRPNPRGRLADLAFRPEPVLVETLYDDGVAVRWRLVAATAEGGLLLGPSPRSTAELAGLWRGAVGPRVTRFRLAGPGVAGYREEVLVTWREGRLVEPRPAPGPPAAPSALPPGPAADR